MGVFWLLALVQSVFGANPDKLEFKQLSLDSPIDEVIYCGPKKDSIIILSEDQIAYRSENSGYSWKEVPIPNSSKISKIVSSKADQRMQAFLGTEGTNWYTEDCGKTVKTLNYMSPMEEFHFHPKMRNWGLAGSWKKCSQTEETCKKYRALYMTKDLGATWEMILDYVVQFAWAFEGLNDDITKDFPDSRIYVTRNGDNEKDQKLSGWNYAVDFLRSDDFFSSSDVIVPHGNKFLLSDKFILVALAVEDDPEEVQLMISNENNIEKFYRAELPVKRIPEHSYTLIDASEGSLFIHVNHYGARSNYGTIYISDASGRRFSISLLHNVRARNGYCDFDKVRGLEGIYIANIYDKEHLLNDYAEESASSKSSKSKKEAQRFQKTVITFDKGGEWRGIEPPERDSEGKRIICEGDCYLHLHSVTSPYSQVYSTENAIGIVMATGNVGRYLSYKEDELNTYLSRDGGLTWIEVKKGEFIYEMGDHGAIIVMADSQKATDTLYFSWNEGLTWEQMILDSPFEVENILIEPTATSQKFLMYGEREGKGVTVSVDFSAYHEPECMNPTKPGSSDSDYEVWSPNDGRSGDCLMGRKVEYVRRKQDAECFNGQEFERPKFIENCECTEEDYECDIGYIRDDSSICSRIENYQIEDPVCGDNQFMQIPTGYRRVAGNTCIGGVSSELEPRIVQCSEESSYIWYAVLAGAVALGGFFVVFKKYGEKINLPAWNLPAFSWPKFGWPKFSWSDTFDKTGFFSDLTKAPEGMEEEEMVNPKHESAEEEFDPRS